MTWNPAPCNDRFDPVLGEKTMKAVVTAGNGGFEKLHCREVKRPRPGAGEVLLRVLAAGMNNTEINTRVGWYSDSVTRATSDTATSEVREAEVRIDGGWNETTPFPFIQGTDCCGRVAEIGPGGDPELLGKRVLVRSCIRPEGFESMETSGWVPISTAPSPSMSKSPKPKFLFSNATGAMPSWPPFRVPTEPRKT